MNITKSAVFAYCKYCVYAYRPRRIYIYIWIFLFLLLIQCNFSALYKFDIFLFALHMYDDAVRVPIIQYLCFCRWCKWVPHITASNCRKMKWKEDIAARCRKKMQRMTCKSKYRTLAIFYQTTTNISLSLSIPNWMQHHTAMGLPMHKHRIYPCYMLPHAHIIINVIQSGKFPCDIFSNIYIHIHIVFDIFFLHAF